MRPAASCRISNPWRSASRRQNHGFGSRLMMNAISPHSIRANQPPTMAAPITRCTLHTVVTHGRTESMARVRVPAGAGSAGDRSGVVVGGGAGGRLSVPISRQHLPQGRTQGAGIGVAEMEAEALIESLDEDRQGAIKGLAPSLGDRGVRDAPVRGTRAA